MTYDIQKIPFSMRGSYMAVSWFQENYDGWGNKEGVYLRSIHGLGYIPILGKKVQPPFVARLVPVFRGKEAAFEIKTQEHLMRLETDRGEIELCFADADTLLILGKGNGMGMRIELVEGNYIIPASVGSGRHLLLNCSRNCRRFLLRTQTGNVEKEKAGSIWDSQVFLETGKGDMFLAGIEDVVEEWEISEKKYSFEESLRQREEDFLHFLQVMPPVPAEYEQARRMASYINWSCLVNGQGLLTREAMLMAKNWMCNVWSWDHCFNAIALSYFAPSLAWDQFMVMFDQQKDNGRLPDSVSDTYAIWNFCKPPVHGWALSRMMQVMEPDYAQCEEAYDRLSRWTNWWLVYRDEDGDGICEYHHGNDSGWDNSTAFRESPVMELPDLATFLILQMDVLEELAGRLGKAEEEKHWRNRSDQMLQAMLTHCFENDRPKAVKSGSHEETVCDSLILYLPVLLGEKLPENIRKTMLSELKGDRFLTAHGYATEAVKSPLYKSDGYWRGPIWAPSTMLLVDGLNRCGESELAGEVARRYCDMVRQNGCAENFDAITGEGLRDKAYTWTSSVFLILAYEELYKRKGV